LIKTKFPQQVISLAIIFAIFITALIVARIILIPKSFGKYGHYRADSVDEIMALPINYAGSDACYDCHDDIVDTKKTSNHKGVGCEVCHGPAAKHVDAPDEFTPDAPRERGQCPLCHGFNTSRPTGFPQIITEQHNPGKPCMNCHEPHNPVLPHSPEECSACHREIANKTKVSHHSTLDCETCHEVAKNHTTSPRLAVAKKPTGRDFCGECHDEGASSPRSVPKIDLSEHNERYLCWDCHYPHFPEAR
jgi:hypothetical protein